MNKKGDATVAVVMAIAAITYSIWAIFTGLSGGG